jgi:translation initiation factor 3 subunit C
MSRFWAGASSSESDSSDEDSTDYSSEEGGNNAGNKWVDFSDSDESDDEARVAKSGKERAMETFKSRISNIRAAMKSRDYYATQTEFDELAKAMINAKKILAEGVPRFLVRILVDLETYIPERLADKAAFKKLSARQGRALNRMKLTLKKHNKPYSVVMEHYRKNPMDDDEEDENGGGDDSDSSSSSSDSDSDSDGDDDGDDDDKKKKAKADDGSVSLETLDAFNDFYSFTRMPIHPISG